jgi:hypothetical protein
MGDESWKFLGDNYFFNEISDSDKGLMEPELSFPPSEPAFPSSVALQVGEGEQGPQGETGPQGEQGEPGEPGAGTCPQFTTPVPITIIPVAPGSETGEWDLTNPDPGDEPCVYDSTMELSLPCSVDGPASNSTTVGVTLPNGGSGTGDLVTTITNPAPCVTAFVFDLDLTLTIPPGGGAVETSTLCRLVSKNVTAPGGEVWVEYTCDPVELDLTGSPPIYREISAGAGDYITPAYNTDEYQYKDETHRGIIMPAEAAIGKPIIVEVRTRTRAAPNDLETWNEFTYQIPKEFTVDLEPNGSDDGEWPIEGDAMNPARWRYDAFYRDDPGGANQVGQPQLEVMMERVIGRAVVASSGTLSWNVNEGAYELVWVDERPAVEVCPPPGEGDFSNPYQAAQIIFTYGWQ